TEVSVLPDLQIPMTPLLAVVLGIVMVFVMYAMEITDGADGLVTGQFLIAMFSYSAIAYLSGVNEILGYLGFMIGSAIVYLYFNINPARVFMGGTGTLPIGFALFAFAMLTDTLPVLLIMGGVFWVELASSTSQILS